MDWSRYVKRSRRPRRPVELARAKDNTKPAEAPDMSWVETKMKPVVVTNRLADVRIIKLKLCQTDMNVQLISINSFGHTEF
jgi:hypothetical protein